MKLFKKIAIFVVAAALALGMSSCAGESPYIGENGNWFVGGRDTGVNASGIKGDTGPQGDSVKVIGFEKVSSKGMTDTYKITFSTGLTTNITLENGFTPTVTAFEPIGEANGKTVYRLSFSTGESTSFVLDSKDGKDGINTVENLDIIYSNTIGNKALTAYADKLENGIPLVIENNAIMNNKHLSLSVDLKDIGNGSISVGHGEAGFGASYLVINKEYVTVYTRGVNLEQKAIKHGLTSIKNNLKVVIDADYNSATVQIMAPGGEIFVSQSFEWSARNGDIFVRPENLTLENVKLTWSCDDYSNNIYMIGDSYFSTTDASRWTSYLIKNGFTNNLMISYSGMASQRGIVEFKQAVEHGTPKFAFWCMGMNDMDTAGEPNADWLAATEEFLEMCEANGITPILSTIPSTAEYNEETKTWEMIRDNGPKNEWVRDWAERTGGRYVDFSAAVCKDENTGEWYNDMLHTDGVHPAKLGAQALYMQAIIDFPELMQK